MDLVARIAGVAGDIREMPGVLQMCIGPYLASMKRLTAGEKSFESFL